MKKIGRNEKCPCGSKKKFKKCCISKPQLPNHNDHQLQKVKNFISSKYRKDWIDISDKITLYNYPDYYNSANSKGTVIIVKKNPKNIGMFTKFIDYNGASTDAKYFFQYKKSTIVTEKINEKLISKLFSETDNCDKCYKLLDDNKYICKCMDMFCFDCLVKFGSGKKCPSCNVDITRT